MATAGSDRARFRRIIQRLGRAYGDPPARRDRPVVDVLIGTILSQNTTDANSSAGFANLKRRFACWDELADAPVRAIERCIRCCGLARIKGPRIRAILRRIRDERGKVDLEDLRAAAPADAYEYLTSFDGVGPKTALCVMMFALGMKVFPVDTHIARVTRRLGFLGADVPFERAHEALGPLIAPSWRYRAHLLLIAHGRRTCRARKPDCATCVVIGLCRWAGKAAQVAVRSA